MRLTFPFVLAGSALLMFASCKKEYSNESKRNSVNEFTDSLPAKYPFSTGLCEVVTLGVNVGEISNVQTDTSLALPASVSLDMPASGNQGSQGSCAAWAVVYGLGSYHNHIINGKPYSDTGNLSPKFTYNQIARGNCGCTSLIDNLYLLRKEGAASLAVMPYDPDECLLQPDSPQIQNAEHARVTDFQRVDMQNLTLIKHVLAANKPIAFGTTLDDGFKHLDSPYIWKEHSGAAGEGHAMVLIGYDDSRNSFRVLNSWSTAWADQGEAWIDYDFFIANVEKDGYVIAD